MDTQEVGIHNSITYYNDIRYKFIIVLITKVPTSTIREKSNVQDINKYSYLYLSLTFLRKFHNYLSLALMVANIILLCCHIQYLCLKKCHSILRRYIRVWYNEVSMARLRDAV